MKSCVDCDNCAVLETGKRICKLKSPGKVEHGTVLYRTDLLKNCHEERIDSTGLFGFFKDKTRCGSSGKNFTPK